MSRYASVDSEVSCYNCGLVQLGSFDCDEEEPMSDRDWFEMLLHQNSLSPTHNLYAFSHSSAQKSKPNSPKNFARWLRKKGESVQASRTVVNPQTKNLITGYWWAPSKKFRKKLENHIKKIEKEEEKEKNAASFADSY